MKPIRPPPARITQRDDGREKEDREWHGDAVALVLTRIGDDVEERRNEDEPRECDRREDGGAPRCDAGELRIALQRRAWGGGHLSAPGGGPIRTADGSIAAHAEHTVVITSGAPLVLTA